MVCHHHRGSPNLIKAGPTMDKSRSQAVDSKACSTCSDVKPLEEFSFDRRRPDSRQARCRECVKAYQKRYKQDNRERYLELRRQEAARRKEKVRAYHQANAEKLREQSRAWEAALTGAQLDARREAHRSASAAYRLKNTDVCNERIRAWKKANPDKAAETTHRRRAWKSGNGTPEKFTRSEIGERDGWTCGICDLPVDKTLRWPDRMSPSLDHIVPLSRGGLHARANSRITHWICNVRRGADRKRLESAA